MLWVFDPGSGSGNASYNKTDQIYSVDDGGEQIEQVTATYTKGC
jgi:hypothetical protein